MKEAVLSLSKPKINADKENNSKNLILSSSFTELLYSSKITAFLQCKKAASYFDVILRYQLLRGNIKFHQILYAESLWFLLRGFP